MQTRLFFDFSFRLNTKSWAPFDSPVTKDFDKPKYAEVMVTCLKHDIIFTHFMQNKQNLMESGKFDICFDMSHCMDWGIVHRPSKLRSAVYQCMVS